MTTIVDSLKQAEFVFAAYAQLSFDISEPELRNAIREAGMSIPQATRFASTYFVVDQCNVSGSGLSATVFADASGQRYLAIRGTDDGYDLVTDAIDIGVLGSTANQAQYAELKAKVQAWVDDGTLSSSFTVSGHSLGGFLATGIAADFATKVTHAYLYNSPGLGGIVGTILSPFDALRSALGIGASSIDPAKVSNIKAEAGISPIAGLGVQVAPVIPIVIENQFLSDVDNPPAARNHSLQPLTDALALYAVFAGLSGSLLAADFNKLLKADSEQNRLTLESALDIARNLLLGEGREATPVGNRDAFYTNLYNLMASGVYDDFANAGGGS